MGWKKAVFFGGAVLVLAACSDSATSPSALRQSGSGASVKLPGSPTETTTTSDSTIVVAPGLIIDGICTGIVIRTGVATDSASTSTCAAQ